MIRFDELVPSISNENGVRVRLWQIEDTPQNSVNLMNILREYPTKYTFSKVLDHKEPVPTV